MKKSLIALATLAATGAFAQVTITGGVAMGYAAGQDANGVQASGLGVDTATLDFGVTEDLGGGMKLIAHQGFDTLTRKTVLGGDTTMTLVTRAGVLSLVTVQAADYTSAFNVSGSINGWDGRITSYRAFADAVQYTLPVTPAITLAVQHAEISGVTGTAEMLGLGIGAAGANSGANSFGVAGTGTTNVIQRRNLLIGKYASGPLMAELNVGSFDNQGVLPGLAMKSQVRGGATYDFGMAKVGFGMDQQNYAAGQTGARTDTLLSVTVPVGALSLGASAIARNFNGTTASDATYNGFGVVANYSLSKSTAVKFAYQTWQQPPTSAAGTAIGVANGLTIPAGYTGNNSTLTEIALVKSF